MKVAVSFSMGKDSMLALHRTVAAGNTPVCLISAFNTLCDRSWFHGADRAMVEAAGKALGYPVLFAQTDGTDYEAAMERALAAAKELGAEACVFGDIDIAQHRQWDEARCAAAGLTALLPLWQESREALVRETVGLGYQCVIKCLNPKLLPDSLLGRRLSEEVLAQLADCGVDLCGENGEYHTIVVDGPMFRRPLELCCGDILRLEHANAIALSLRD